MFDCLMMRKIIECDIHALFFHLKSNEKRNVSLKRLVPSNTF